MISAAWTDGIPNNATSAKATGSGRDLGAGLGDLVKTFPQLGIVALLQKVRFAMDNAFLASRQKLHASRVRSPASWVAVKLLWDGIFITISWKTLLHSM